MEFKGKDKILFDRWHSLHLQERGTDDASLPSDKGDVTRSLLTQVEYATAAKLVSPVSGCKLLLEQHDNYSQVADVSAEQGGFDNYSEGALVLLEGKRNESKHWKSSLTMERAADLACVQKFIQTSKVAKECIIPSNKENTPLILKPPKSEGPVIQNTHACISSVNRQPIFKKNLPADSKPVQTQSVGVNSPLDVDCRLPQMPHHQQGEQNRAGPLYSGHGDNKTGRKTPVAGTESQEHLQREGSGGFWNMGDGSERPRAYGKNTNSSVFKSGVQNSTQSTGLWGGSAQNNPGTYTSKQSWNPNTTSQGWNPTRSTMDPGPGTSAACNFYDSNSGGNQPQYRKPEPMKRPRGNPFGEEDEEPKAPSSFKTAKEQLAIDSQKKFGRGRGAGDRNPSTSAYGTNKKSLGTRRGPSSKFVPPVMAREDQDDGGTLVKKAGANKAPMVGSDGELIDERLRHIEPKMIELVMNEVMDHGAAVSWEDIAGLEFAKKTIKEIVVWPMLRPDIFTGLRGPPKGLLLFGPPGTGKTLIGKCIASQSKSTFFSISASSLTSKWVGEGEKMVRALFAVARVNQPAVIFMDEIDSLLSQRSDGENEGSRRIKTEFLIQLDGATTGEDDRILVVGATNRPQEIDEAARRRFVKRLYIPLPESIARQQIVINLMSQQKHGLSDCDLDHICQNTDGYSGADMANLCREAALGPIRSIAFEDIGNITAEQVGPIVISDFQDALQQVRASVSDKDLNLYIDWNKQYGSFGNCV